MKNKICFLGIIAIVAIIGLSMSSCEEIVFGGSLTIKNNTSTPILAYAGSFLSFTNPSSTAQTIAAGQSYTWEFSMDGEVYYNWASTSSSLSDMANINKKVYISGGKNETFTVTSNP